MKSWCTIAFAIIVSVPLFAGQGPSNGPSAKPQSPSVTIPLFVTDSHGTPLSGITQNDLTMFDDKSLRPLLGVTKANDVPLRLGVLIDTSKSERDSALYKAGLQALFPFLKQVLTGTEDRVFVETFEATPIATNFMTLGELANHRFNASPGGATALYDGIDFACSSRLKNDPVHPARRVLVILTDGEDNQSHLTRDQAIASAQRAAAVIFVISTHSGWNDDRGDSTVRALAERTGGTSFVGLSPGKLPEVFSEVKEQINAMYLATFVPAESARDYHRIEVKAISGKKLKVHAPQGFYTDSMVVRSN